MLVSPYWRDVGSVRLNGAKLASPVLFIAACVSSPGILFLLSMQGVLVNFSPFLMSSSLSTRLKQ